MVSRGRICRGGLRSDGAVGRIQCPKAADYVVTLTPNQVEGMSQWHYLKKIIQIEAMK